MRLDLLRDAIKELRSGGDEADMHALTEGLESCESYQFPKIKIESILELPERIRAMAAKYPNDPEVKELMRLLGIK